MLFSHVRHMDPEKDKNLKWECLKSLCPSSCCFVPDRTLIVLDEVPRLSKYFPVVITVEVDQQGNENPLLCAYLRLREDKRGCVYLLDGKGCTLEDEKPYTCKQYPFFISQGCLAMDLTCPGFSTDKGKRIFDGDHINSDFERDFFAYALSLEKAKAQTEEFLRVLFEKDLVVGYKFVFEKVEIFFNAVDEDKLLELPKDVLKEFSSKGYLRIIYAHLNSLQNWEKLTRRLNL